MTKLNIIYKPDSKKTYTIENIKKDFPEVKLYFSSQSIDKIESVCIYNAFDDKKKTSDLGIIIIMKTTHNDKITSNKILKHTYYNFVVCAKAGTYTLFDFIGAEKNKFIQNFATKTINYIDHKQKNCTKITDFYGNDINRNSKIINEPAYIKMGNKSSINSIKMKLFQPKATWEDNTYYYNFSCIVKRKSSSP